MLYPCRFPDCSYEATTTGDHIIHQRYAATFNFIYTCPLPTCHATFSTYNNVSSHISRHTIQRHQSSGMLKRVECGHCDVKLSNNYELCIHLKEHLKKGEAVQCPLEDCHFTKLFSKLSTFSTHLSLYHPGWRQDLHSTEAPMDEEVEENEEPQPSAAHSSFDDYVFEDGNFGDGLEEIGSDHDGWSDASSETNDVNENDFSYDMIITYIANFYALLEGKHVVPSSTVDIIAERLAFISEVLQDELEKKLTRALTAAQVEPELTSSIVSSILSTDPLYNSHHKNTFGVCLLTSHLRRNFYKKHFKYVEPTEINLKKDPRDREETLQYVDLKKTLQVMLEDPTVQREVEESFEKEYLHGSAISDYPTGSVFKNFDNPRKRIDLLMFMDGFSCVYPLGSAKKKYKMHGMYVTLGNLKPHFRSLLKSMRLVLIVNNDLLQTPKKFKKCFSRVVADLKDLEENGVPFKDETIDVRLQFFQGDILGQHTIGGFIESFTGNYFCRFCDIPKSVFKAEATQKKPKFSIGKWRTHQSFCAALEMKKSNKIDNFQGVKRDSPFNSLQHFKVCDPRLAPCIAHDLFIGGVVDCDTAAIIAYFVDKELFTYNELKGRVRRFRYLEGDMRNKPADVHDKGKKFGGHAVQNWTLFRLLPFLIGDKIDPADKRWKLYLLLKSILELVCAPSLSFAQIELMRRLIAKYMKKRRILKTNYKPKHHFFFHYADLFLKFGALIYHWTLAFEHFHQYFKKVARTCGNFINLGFTLASKFQLLQAYRSMGNLFPINPILKRSHPLSAESHDGPLKDFLIGCNFTENALEVESLTVNSITYKRNQWLLLEKDQNNIFIGNIELITYDQNVCKIVMLRYKSTEWCDYGVHYIHERNPVRCIVPLDGTLENPCPHAVYDLLGKRCFSLKHAFLSTE